MVLACLRYSIWKAHRAFEGICGGLAQLGERLPCKQEVSGSIPLISTNSNRGLERSGDGRSEAPEKVKITGDGRPRRVRDGAAEKNAALTRANSSAG